MKKLKASELGLTRPKGNSTKREMIGGWRMRADGTPFKKRPVSKRRQK